MWALLQPAVGVLLVLGSSHVWEALRDGLPPPAAPCHGNGTLGTPNLPGSHSLLADYDEAGREEC